MVFFMKPNFEEMTKAKLKAYVLKHRDDIEAIRFLFRIPPGVEVKRYPPSWRYRRRCTNSRKYPHYGTGNSRESGAR